MAVGIDVSMSSVAGFAVAWDYTLREFLGPVSVMKRWEKNTHYFERIEDCSRAHNFIHDLQVELKLVAELDEVYIAVEEPWPVGIIGRMESSWLKQQAEISGAFLAGLLRYGYKNVFQINNNFWRGIVADDLGITIHYSKWDKWKPKEWAARGYTRQDGEVIEIPDWPDLINHSKKGKIPRPENSKAKAVQPDDRYDALGVMAWMEKQIET